MSKYLLLSMVHTGINSLVYVIVITMYDQSIKVETICSYVAEGHGHDSKVKVEYEQWLDSTYAAGGRYR